MAKIKFKCPYCNDETLKQVRRFATVSQKIHTVSAISMTLDEEHEINGGNAPHFECGKCGTALHHEGKPITEIKNLYECLRSVDMLETDQTIDQAD